MHEGLPIGAVRYGETPSPHVVGLFGALLRSAPNVVADAPAGALAIERDRTRRDSQSPPPGKPHARELSHRLLARPAELRARTQPIRSSRVAATRA